MSVFVSHAAADKVAVKDIMQILSEAKLDVWYDQDLQVGDVWWAEILLRIRHCQVFIFVVSDASVRSKPCLAELQYARDLNRVILPIEIQKLSHQTVNPVSDIQMIPMMRITRQSAVQLVSAAFQGQSEAPKLPVELPREPAIPYAYLQELLNRIQNSSLGSDEQLIALNMLGQNYADEVNGEARERIADVMRQLASKPWATKQSLQTVEQILGRRAKRALAGFRARGISAGRPDSHLTLAIVFYGAAAGLSFLIGVGVLIGGIDAGLPAAIQAGIALLLVSILFLIRFRGSTRHDV